MTAARRVEPEWLDVLPQDDLGARRSRRDLRLLNAIMFQPRVMARLLMRLPGSEPPRTIVDLGAGDGTLLLAVAGRLPASWHHAKAVLVDRQALVTPETRARFAALGWRAEPVAADVFDFLGQARPDDAGLVIANLFLHHFADGDLERLLALAARLAPRFAACEPRRAPLALAGSHAVRLLGCNPVTRHDAVVSVRAGFRDAELSALWRAPGGWRLHEGSAGLFTHCFTALRGD